MTQNLKSKFEKEAEQSTQPKTSNFAQKTSASSNNNRGANQGASSGGGNIYGFAISNNSSGGGGGGSGKPQIITDKLFHQTATAAPKKSNERGIQKGTGERPNYSGT